MTQKEFKDTLQKNLSKCFSLVSISETTELFTIRASKRIEGRRFDAVAIMTKSIKKPADALRFCEKIFNETFKQYENDNKRERAKNNLFF